LPGGAGEARTEGDKEFASKFNFVLRADGCTPDGFLFSQNTYRGPDGEKVYFRTFHYHSAERARAEFDSRVKPATKVFDRVATKRDGGAVDETAVLVTIGENGKPLSMLVANVGRTFGASSRIYPRTLNKWLT
jgi:hypothetical protein